MKNKAVFKRLIIVAIAAVLILGSVFLISYLQGNLSRKLVVTDLDVGKADSAVIKYGDVVGLIDTGTSDAFDTIDSFLKENKVADIDYMILTHYDKDHIGSAVDIMNSYDVGNIYLADYESEKKYYTQLMEAVKDRDDVTFVTEPVNFSYDDLTIEILPAEDPEKLKDESNKLDNDMSLVCMMTLGESDLLFTGDVEKKRIKQMVKSAEDGEEDFDCDWIKIPHHGEYQKAEKELLEIATPEYSVISTSEEQPPDEKLLELLEDKSVQNFNTFDGNVVTVCDKDSINVKNAAPAAKR